MLHLNSATLFDGDAMNSTIYENGSPLLKNFYESAKAHNVASRSLSGFSEGRTGFYVVAGVFGDSNNAQKFKKQLISKSLNANILRHKESKLNYVYINFNQHWEQPLKLIQSDFNGTYTDKTWILHAVTSKSTIVPAKQKVQTRSLLKNKGEISFLKTAKKNNIPAREISGLSNLSNGFYLIAGVYGDSKNTKKTIAKLKRNTLDPQYFVNPENNLNYIYLKKYTDPLRAIKGYQTRLNGSYNGKLWILQVNNPETKTELDKLTVPNSRESKISTKKGPYVRKSNGNERLLEKANSYFNKMWYSEAADIYELILEEEGKNASYEIIQKAADAHYYNTNMERAYYWYDILFKEYKSEMSNDNIFKYAHALKGTGKYARAKRLMKLYNRKSNLTKAVSNDIDEDYTEVLLDNLLKEKDLYTIANLDINTRYSEFSPSFYGENRMVFASSMDSLFLNTRRYKWNNQPYLDLYVAKINQETKEVRDAIKFSKKINTKYHEASVSFSPDNSRMYFTRNNYGKKLKRDKNGVNNLKIYTAKKVNGEWTDIEELPFNSDSYSTGHPALSPDGKHLYFVSDMPGTIGKTDIFVVDILGDGEYSEPRNLGPNINTEQREMFPFINDKKLYFSSDGHTGLGGLDVFEASISQEGTLEEIRNVGQPVNSKSDDFSYIVNESTQEGFFASNRTGGKGDDDIYSFKRLLPEEANENAIAGVVTEKISGQKMPSALVTLLDENNIKLKELDTNQDGSFVFEDLESSTKYIIRTEKEGYFNDISTIETNENKLVEIDVSLKKLKELIVIEDGIKKLKTEMIFFDFDKAHIRNDARSELDKLVEVMQEYPSMVIRIESHTDSRGKKAYNKYLSDKRAKSTREYIISKGIDPARIESAIGFGEERLLNECNGTVRCSSSKHQLNRRSEFIIVKM